MKFHKAVGTILLCLGISSQAQVETGSWVISTNPSIQPQSVAFSAYHHFNLAPYPALTTTFPFPSRFKGKVVSYCYFLPGSPDTARMPEPTMTIIQPTESSPGSITITRQAYSSAEVAKITQSKIPVVYSLTGACQAN